MGLHSSRLDRYFGHDNRIFFSYFYTYTVVADDADPLVLTLTKAKEIPQLSCLKIVEKLNFSPKNFWTPSALETSVSTIAVVFPGETEH